MSTRIEWGSVKDLILHNPGEIVDQYGSTNEQWALAAFGGSDGICLQGSLTDIIDTLSDLTEAARTCREVEIYHELQS